jgi:autotransporter-associated beta strand protein
VKRSHKRSSAVRRRLGRSAAQGLLAVWGAGTFLATAATAADFTVSNTNDSGAGSLRQAIINSNAAGGSNTINFATSGTVTLASDLPAITSSVSIAGNGATLDGANAHRGLLVYSGTVAIQNFIIQNATATGGKGGDGNGAGGGGAGLGGALFVAAGASVTGFNLSIVDNKAVGGAGGGYNLNFGGGGGGGLGGDGGQSGQDPEGTGGGGGVGRVASGGGSSSNGAAGIVAGQPGGGAGALGAAGTGGPSGGGGGGGGITSFAGGGGGGGIGGGSGTASTAGNGGFGGGGGGLSALPNLADGNGGFGGGGGGGGGSGAGGGGNGGFGGGSGGAAQSLTAASAGFGGGTGGSYGGGGGGGLGAGGGIFVQQGGNLLLTGPLIIGGNSVASGSGGSSQYGSSGTAGSAFGAGIFLQGNGQLTFSAGTEGQTITDVVADQTGSGGTGANAGSYQLVINGPGTLYLQANNSYSGGTLVNGATLWADSDASLGTVSGALTLMGGTFQPLRSIDTSRQIVMGGGNNTILVGTGIELAAPVAGPGNLTKVGLGLMTLKDSSTFTGNLVVNQGTVGLAAADFSHIPVITVASSTTLAINAPTVAISALSGSGTVSVGSNTLRIGVGTSFAGSFTGNGQILVAAPVHLSGASSFSGTVGIGADATLGLIGAASLAAASQIQFEYTGASTGAFDISGTNAGASVNVLSDTVGGGVVNLGSRTLSIAQNSTFAGVLRDGGSGGGTGGQLNVAGATTTLGGANTYTGATTVQGGARLALTGAGSITTSSQVNLAGILAVFDIAAAAGGRSIQSLTGQAGSVVALGANSLTVGNSASTTFAGSIAGTGTLIKQGTGTLTLTGANAVGGTTVNGGLLVVNGSLTGGVTVAAGGAIGGIGTISGPFVSNGGILAPGNSIGTLNVNGSFAQNGTTYAVEVNAGGQSDLINVSGAPGTATINGGTVQVLAQSGSYRQTTTYTILTATGGVSGTYSGVTSNLAFLTPSLSYGANNVLLTLTRSANAFASGAQTQNQLAVATVLDLVAPMAAGDFADAHAAMIGLTTGQGPAALDAISGQPYTGFGTMNIAAGLTFLNTVGRQVADARAGGGSGTRVALAAADEAACAADTCDAMAPTNWSAWLSGLAGFGSVGGNTNAGMLTYSLGGAAVGVDYRFDPRFVAGLAIGFSSGQQWVGGFQGNGWSNTYSAALYGSFAQGGFYADGLVGYGWSDNRMQRVLSIPGLASLVATGNTGASQFLGQIEVGYRIGLHEPTQVSLTPFARFQTVAASQNGFAESGANSLSLVVANQNTTSIRTVLGVDLAANLPIGSQRTLGTTLRLGWAHEYASTVRPMTASFAGAPGVPFTVYGAEPLRNAAVIGFGLNTKIGERTSIYARYDGEITGRDDMHAVSAGFRFTW